MPEYFTVSITIERIVAGVAILLTLLIMSADPREQADGSIKTETQTQER